MSTQKELRVLTVKLATDVATLRTASFNNRQHLVVPVIMLVGNSVVRPSGSRGPEFVPAEELNTAVGGWNGRPILPDHPAGSANEPAILESHAFGHIFNAHFDTGDNKLKAEAWLDTARAEELGGDPLSVIQRCQAGEIVEVSVGAYVLMEERTGTHNDQPYEYIWHNPVPDHLAMLPLGVLGACSVEMGCGAPRLMRALQANANANANDKESSMMDTLRSFGARLVGAASPAGLSALAKEKGKSDMELRRSLENALFSSVPAFMGVSEVFPDSKTVIYMTSGDNGWQYWRRGYTVDGESISLATDEEEVVQEVVYKPLSSVTTTTETLQHACSCQHGEGKEPSTPAEIPAAPTDTAASSATVNTESTVETITEGATMDTKTLAGRLIASARSPFTEDHRVQLEAMSLDALSTLETQFGEAINPTPSPNPAPNPNPAPTPSPTPAPNPTPKAAGPGDPGDEGEGTEPTEQEQIAALPAALRELAQEAYDNRQSERNRLVASLSKKAPGVLSPEKLKSKTLTELRELAAVAQVSTPKADFSASRIVPASQEPVAVPDPWDIEGRQKRQRERRSA